MIKDAFYFSHDANARNDTKLLPIRMKYGMRGYGIFFGIVELLREANNYQLPKNWEAIAYDLRESASDIEDIVSNYQLFTVNGSTFWSSSLKARMKKREEVSQRRALAGKLGGDANAAKTKGKKRQPKKSAEFEKIWSQYPTPVGKIKASLAFHASVLTPKDHLDVWTALNNYKASARVAKGYIQNGDTWFRNWKDWVNINVDSPDGIPAEWKTPNNSIRK